MTEASDSAVPLSHAATRPPGAREFTLRAVIVSLLVAALIGASYPYIVLKLGFGPNIAVVSAFFGYLMLTLFARKMALRWESNLAQAAGTTAGQTGFLCTIMAAFDMLTMDPTVGVNLTLTPMQTFLWLTTAGTLGVLLAVPMRRHFIEDEKLAFPDGVAAGETLIVLDSRGEEAKTAISSMLQGLLASALLSLATLRARMDEFILFKANAFSPVTGVGFSLSLLNLGSGMIIGLRICANMFVGLCLSWVIAPLILHNNEIIPATPKKSDILLWVMWPATGMMVAGGLAALFLKWKVLKRSFSGLSGSRADSGDFPMRWVVIGAVVSLVALVAVQYYGLHLPVWQTLLAVLFTLPLMLVGLRVLGETNWGPISALSNLMQGVFGVLVPHNIQANMVASGVTGSVVAESEGLIQSYKTGHMIGATPRYLTYVQLMAVPVGAGAVALMYPLLKESYGIGGEKGLSSPISQKWVGFAKLLSQGIDAVPRSAVWALAAAVVLGILFTVLEQNPKIRNWVPSPTGIGIGMLVPASAVATMFLGAWIEYFLRKRDPTASERWILPLASGLIAGEALIAVILAVVYALKWSTPP